MAEGKIKIPSTKDMSTYTLTLPSSSGKITTGTIKFYKIGRLVVVECKFEAAGKFGWLVYNNVIPNEYKPLADIIGVSLGQLGEPTSSVIEFNKTGNIRIDYGEISSAGNNWYNGVGVYISAS